MSEEKPRTVCHLSPIPKSPVIGTVRSGRIARHFATGRVLGIRPNGLWSSHPEVTERTSSSDCPTYSEGAPTMKCPRPRSARTFPESHPLASPLLI